MIPRDARRGLRGFTGLERCLRAAPAVDLGAFKGLMRSQELDLARALPSSGGGPRDVWAEEERALRLLFGYLDPCATGLVHPQTVLACLRDPIAPVRAEMVAAAFRELDAERRGSLEAEAVVAAYAAERHPDVLSGRRTAADVRCEFLDCFDGGIDGRVTLAEFASFHANVSAALDQPPSGSQDRRDDAHFSLVLRSTWSLGDGAYAGLGRAPDAPHAAGKPASAGRVGTFKVNAPAVSEDDLLAAQGRAVVSKRRLAPPPLPPPPPPGPLKRLPVAPAVEHCGLGRELRPVAGRGNRTLEGLPRHLMSSLGATGHSVAPAAITADERAPAGQRIRMLGPRSRDHQPAAQVLTPDADFNAEMRRSETRGPAPRDGECSAPRSPEAARTAAAHLDSAARESLLVHPSATRGMMPPTRLRLARCPRCLPYLSAPGTLGLLHQRLGQRGLRGCCDLGRCLRMSTSTGGLGTTEFGMALQKWGLSEVTPAEAACLFAYLTGQPTGRDQSSDIAQDLHRATVQQLIDGVYGDRANAERMQLATDTFRVLQARAGDGDGLIDPGALARLFDPRGHPDWRPGDEVLTEFLETFECGSGRVSQEDFAEYYKHVAFGVPLHDADRFERIVKGPWGCLPPAPKPSPPTLLGLSGLVVGSTEGSPMNEESWIAAQYGHRQHTAPHSRDAGVGDLIFGGACARAHPQGNSY